MVAEKQPDSPSQSVHHSDLSFTFPDGFVVRDDYAIAVRLLLNHQSREHAVAGQDLVELLLPDYPCKDDQQFHFRRLIERVRYAFSPMVEVCVQRKGKPRGYYLQVHESLRDFYLPYIGKSVPSITEVFGIRTRVREDSSVVGIRGYSVISETVVKKILDCYPFKSPIANKRDQPGEVMGVSVSGGEVRLLIYFPGERLTSSVILDPSGHLPKGFRTIKEEEVEGLAKASRLKWIVSMEKVGRSPISLLS